jgi:phenylalanyl-tRNA synthetase beta chain
MKIPISWLKEFVDIDLTPEQIARKLSMSGTEVSTVDGNVLDVEILPNRGDCLSIIGIAREICALTDKPLKSPDSSADESGDDIKKLASVEVKDPRLCPRYMARVISDVKIKPSPDWMQKKLTEAGMRPINNIVDVTNYILLESGQPLHAFDLDLLQDKKIIVRKALKGEKITTLDGTERLLTEDDLLICDAKRSVAVAGVMGGQNTEVSGSTKNILLESAYFNPTSINKTSKHLKIRSEASMRFERGIDFNNVGTALDRAAQLMMQLSEGKIAKGKIDIVEAHRNTPVPIKFRFNRINQILGIDVPRDSVISILKGLGFNIVGTAIGSVPVPDSIDIIIPSWRAGDVEREIDVIEEIARIWGYEKIAETFPRISNPASVDEKIRAAVSKEKELRALLVNSGFCEAKTYSMTGEKLLKKAGLSSKGYVEITNPLVEEMTHLRGTMIPGLLEAAEYNSNRQMTNIALFEIGKVFSRKDGKNAEKNTVAGILTGSVYSGAIEKDRINEDFYFIKGILENIFDLYGACCAEYMQSDQEKLAAGKRAEIFYEGEKIGFVGEVSTAISSDFKLQKPAYVFTLDLDFLNALKNGTKIFRELPKYPSIKRDVAMFIPAGVTHEKIVEEILAAGGHLIEDVFAFDRFSGKGRTSTAYSIIYREKAKTLTDEEINFVHEKVMTALENSLKVEIRK